jgi:Fic family protein
MARQSIELILEKRVDKLKEEEKSKNEQLIQIQKELRRYETALESLRKDIPSRKRRGKEETIHPFLDGNGRIGRLLIALQLHHGGVLAQPLLNLSLYFKQHRDEYYRLLDLVRTDGDWKAWLDFFLEGVEQTANGAVQTAQRLVQTFKEDADRIRDLGRTAITSMRVFDSLRSRPILSLKEACKRTGLSFPAAANGMNNLVRLGIVKMVQT